jgi:hypothetical protein
VQSNKAFFTMPTTFTPNLTSASRSGSTIVLLVATAADGNTGFTLPAGWLRVANVTDGNPVGLHLFYYPNAPAGTAFGVFTMSAGANLSYTMAEVGTTLSLDQTGSGSSATAAVTTLSVSTSAATTTASELVIAGFGVSQGASRLANSNALAGGSTFGVTTDCTTCYVSATNLADQLEMAGETWRAYLEGMPYACFVGDAYPYMQKHNPWIYFDDIRNNATRSAADVVPYTQLSTDLTNNTVPNFAWITPNVCNHMHDCSIPSGDAWLSQQVPAILNSAAYKNGGAIFITWDNGNSYAACCTDASGRVATIVLLPLEKSAFRRARRRPSMACCGPSKMRGACPTWATQPAAARRRCQSTSNEAPDHRRDGDQPPPGWCHWPRRVDPHVGFGATE